MNVKVITYTFWYKFVFLNIFRTADIHHNSYPAVRFKTRAGTYVGKFNTSIVFYVIFKGEH